MRPRDFSSGDNGYHNAALGVGGIAIPCPVGASGAIVSVSAGCYCSFRDNGTLVTFNDANFGSILNGAPYSFTRWSSGGETDSFLHIAPWSGTAVVAVAFV